MVLRFWFFFQQPACRQTGYRILKTGLKKEKVDWPESVVWFFKGLLEIHFWTVMDIG